MAQEWYQKATVQAAMAGGVFVVTGALITGLWHKQELTNLRRAEFEVGLNVASGYTEIESEHRTLLSSLASLADAYKRLSEDLRLTEAERDHYKSLHEETKARLEEQRLLTEVATARRVQADSTLKKLEERVSKSGAEYVTAIEERDQCNEQYDNIKGKLVQAEIVIAALKKRLDEGEIGSSTGAEVSLRHAARNNISEQDVKVMLKRHDFYCAEDGWSEFYSNSAGKGIPNAFNVRANGLVVYDRTTGLMWQQSGSENSMSWKDAQKYVQKLNEQKFTGYNDWRLPTLEEAMSLMEPEKKSNDSYIDPVFDRKQWWIWTADKVPAGAAWVVSFYYGCCYDHPVDDDRVVRAVRSGQSII